MKKTVLIGMICMSMLPTVAPAMSKNPFHGRWIIGLKGHTRECAFAEKSYRCVDIIALSPGHVRYLTLASGMYKVSGLKATTDNSNTTFEISDGVLLFNTPTKTYLQKRDPYEGDGISLPDYMK